jgi:predicted RNase H-like nuclease (RuvC/YqgF family)
MENFIRSLFTHNPYEPFTVEDIKEAILENKDSIQNVSVFIRNDSLEDKIKHFLDKFMDEPGFQFTEPNKILFYPDIKMNVVIDDMKAKSLQQDEKINEQQKRIEELEKKLEELTKQFEELTVKKKKFFLF